LRQRSDSPGRRAFGPATGGNPPWAHPPGTGRGTYVLLLALDEPLRLTVGRLGTFDFKAGFYAYVGRAGGPGGLQARLDYHRRPVRRPHWHIDYLKARGLLREIWYRRSAHIEEHRWFDCLRAMRGAQVPVAGFGSSDCRCPAHLAYFRRLPSMAAYGRLLHRSSGRAGRLHRLLLTAG
jgi:Uri superfamily endonuclease